MKKKYHSESGLNQRDEGACDFFATQVFVVPRSKTPTTPPTGGVTAAWAGFVVQQSIVIIKIGSIHHIVAGQATQNPFVRELQRKHVHIKHKRLVRLRPPSLCGCEPCASMGLPRAQRAAVRRSASRAAGGRLSLGARRSPVVVVVVVARVRSRDAARCGFILGAAAVPELGGPAVAIGAIPVVAEAVATRRCVIWMELAHVQTSV